MRNRSPNHRTANATGTGGSFNSSRPDLRSIQVHMPSELFGWIKESAARDGRTLAAEMRDFAEAARAAEADCLFETRADDEGPATGSSAGRAWCQTHGFACPRLNPTAPTQNSAVK